MSGAPTPANGAAHNRQRGPCGIRLKMSRARRSSECPRVRYSRQNASSSSGRGLGVGVTGYRIRSAQALHSAPPSPNPTADPGSGQYACARLIWAAGHHRFVPRDPRVREPPWPVEPVVGARRLRERTSTFAPSSASTAAATPATTPSSARDGRPTVVRDAIQRSHRRPSPSASSTSSPARIRTTSRPAPDGGVWYTGQHDGTLGHLDPATGDVRDDPARCRVRAARRHHRAGRRRLDHRRRPERDRPGRCRRPTRSRPSRCRRTGRGANLNTAVFDTDGILWFTGQTGIYGRLDPATGAMEVFDAPEGRGPYGITATPSGDIWYASLAGSHIAHDRPGDRRGDDRRAADAEPGRPPGLVRLPRPDLGQRVGRRPGRRPRPGDRRVEGVAAPRRRAAGLRRLRRRPRHRLADRLRRERDRPIRPVDRDVRLRRAAERDAAVRQLLGRPGEVWGAESARDKLVLVTED